jgi:hypothetical protein
MRNRRVPVVVQMDSVECGAVCLTMVLSQGESQSYFGLYCLSQMSSDFRLLRHRRLSEAAVMDSSKFVLANGWPIRDVVVRVAGQRDSSRFQGQIRKKWRGDRETWLSY